jgi:hypothetical protein
MINLMQIATSNCLSKLKVNNNRIEVLNECLLFSIQFKALKRASKLIHQTKQPTNQPKTKEKIRRKKEKFLLDSLHLKQLYFSFFLNLKVLNQNY